MSSPVSPHQRLIFVPSTAGNLSQAFVSVVWLGKARGATDPGTFWTKLVEAADLLGAQDDERFTEAAQYCRENAERF
jgi:hypothetical protein